MKPRQMELGNLTYSVGDYVWAKHAGHTLRRSLARVQSAQPIRRGSREVWLVRIYRGERDAPLRSMRGWQAMEHREVFGPLNDAEVAEHRKAGVIPPAGQALP